MTSNIILHNFARPTTKQNLTLAKGKHYNDYGYFKDILGNAFGMQKSW